MKIIAVEKIDITSLIESRIIESAEISKQRTEKRSERIEKLTPYIAQALFGMVDIHNKLVKIGSDKKFLNCGIIEDKAGFVNEVINNKRNWKEPRGTEMYTNVTFEYSSLLIWLSDNYGCMRYTSNPIYQIYGYNEVEDFLNKLIKQVF